jgi:hypothetical protein
MATNKKNKSTKKTGKEIFGLYKDLKTAGLQPEDALLYLLGHMHKLKAKEIGMDMTDENGKKMTLVVAIRDPKTVCEEDEARAVDVPIKRNKYDLSSVN